MPKTQDEVYLQALLDKAGFASTVGVPTMVLRHLLDQLHDLREQVAELSATFV